MKLNEVNAKLSIEKIGDIMAKRTKVALVAHPKSIDQVHHFVSLHRKGYDRRRMSDDLLRKMVDWCPACKLVDFEMSSSHNSDITIDGLFMAASFFPELLLFDREKVIRKIEDAIITSEELGAEVATLGAFTSIADGQQGAIVSKVAKSMAVTNGTTLTTVMTIEGILKAAKMLGADLKESNVAIVGATGSIGRTCSRYFIGKTRKLTLTGRKMEKLEKFFSESQDDYSNIVLTTDNNAAVADADFVICVTSSIKSIFESSAFKTGAVVSDVGFPKNIANACTDRSDLIVYAGGLARLPGEIEGASVWGLPSDSVIYGCLTEGIVIGMERAYELCMVGMEDIPMENVTRLRDLAFMHGVKVPHFSNDVKVYTEEDFDFVKRAREKYLNYASLYN